VRSNSVMNNTRPSNFASPSKKMKTLERKPMSKEYIEQNYVCNLFISPEKIKPIDDFLNQSNS